MVCLITTRKGKVGVQNDFSQFTNLYSLSKTLRFELKPQGKTLENIQKHGLLEQDEQRASSYKDVKKIIDRYHKKFIERTLSNFSLKYESENKKDSLSEYYYYYLLDIKDEVRAENLKKVQENLRKQIADQFAQDDAYKRIDKKELIKEDLVNFVKTAEEKQLVEEFKDFTTYFTGFHENRKNMYSSEEKSTAISYRLVNENLPKFVDNLRTFEEIAATAVSDKFAKLYSDFRDYLNVKSVADMFKLDYYSTVLTQTQIDIYNAIIGGRTEKEGQPKIQGLNEYINLYNQQQENKKARLPKLKPLFKQILSDRDAISWLPEAFKSDNEVLENIEKCYQDLAKNVFEDKKGDHRSLKNLMFNLNDYDLKKIYIRNDHQLTDISKEMFGDWNIIQRAVETDFERNNPQKPKENSENYEKRKQKFVKSFPSLSLSYINGCLSVLGEPYNKLIEDYFIASVATNDETKQKENLFARVTNAYAEAKELLNTVYPDNKNLSQDKIAVEKVKTLLDAVKDLQRFVKPLLGKGDEADKDERFYSEFSALWEQLDAITTLYNKVRNYMTRKPYSTEKIKLNFENSTLMDGWDLNKERDNTTVILRKNGLYYLGIMNKKFNKIFDIQNLRADGECYEKMEYKLLPGANKMLPKVFFSKSHIDEFKPSETLLENYQKETHKKGADFNIKDCHALIDFFKTSISKHKDWKNFDFHFSDTNSYEDLSGFYREMGQQGYKITFRNVSEAYVAQLVDDGKLYLFQIYNKDFSPHSKGTPNMHTLYWKMLFDERNLQNVVYKLNGQAEVFFRKSSLLCEKPTHPVNIPIDNKNPENKKRQSTFEYDLIKDRRYTVDKFQFHVPITMNFKAIGKENVNQLVNDYLSSNKTTYIIGIDRGERHLLYLTVIDLKGNIKEQYSLNEIINEYKGNTYHTNYHDLLDVREKERDKARKSWQTIETIKELKEGYLSQVVHKISQLIVKYSAIVVLEDLSFGFMRGRQKVEKQVYQKFEKMLIDKLNYLVDKQKKSIEVGGVLKAYQLTNRFESFKKLGKQSGILFYVPAWNTSKMDPTTGFVNLINTKYENIEKAKSLFGKFKRIAYNADKRWFEFEIDNYNQFSVKAEDTRQDWVLCTYGSRIDTFRHDQKNNQWESRELDLTQEFRDFFAQYNFDLNENLKEQIMTQDKKEFFKELLHLLRLTLQMRNSKTGTDIDYLISPVMNDKGEFYDSRTCGDNLPQNADANGAYNIARKGLWVIQQIKQTDDLRKLKLAISNKDWLNFIQNQEYKKL